MADTKKILAQVPAGSATTGSSLLGVDSGAIKRFPITALANLLYPVGSYYWSSNPTDPGRLFGGTWEQIKGRFLVAVGALEENNNTWFGTVKAGDVNCPAGEKGGEAWHTLTVNQMPSHDHRDMRWGGSSGNENGYFGVNAGSETSGRQANWYFNYAPGAAQAYFKTGFSGGNAAHNNMPPYLAVYMWKRTA